MKLFLFVCFLPQALPTFLLLDYGYSIYGSDVTVDIKRVQSTFHIELFNKAEVDEVTFLRSLSKLQAEPRT